MTRFARAKGSKASNLKAPEDSTPWEVMKEHMLKAKQENEESKKREEVCCYLSNFSFKFLILLILLLFCTI